ncbi:hypothetical protein, partial [Phocaeicola vulgatus]|uniref:hypothetical protein n=1 Tax=Phocaeicola vulgatus TaxID=821 RepID=UPI0035671147
TTEKQISTFCPQEFFSEKQISTFCPQEFFSEKQISTFCPQEFCFSLLSHYLCGKCGGNLQVVFLCTQKRTLPLIGEWSNLATQLL